MLVVKILTDIQYLLKGVFSFEEVSNIENHSPSDFQHPTTKFSWTKFSILPPTGRISPHTLTLFGKPWYPDICLWNHVCVNGLGNLKSIIGLLILARILKKVLLMHFWIQKICVFEENSIWNISRLFHLIFT